MCRALALFVLTVAAVGCASTTVKQNPGPHDHGFRFYRPKPYLLIKPAPATDAKDTSEFVSIEWTMLPDFSEQYSLHARAGVGTNATKVTLAQGWRLDSVLYNMDSKTDDNIKAVGSLIKSIGGAFAPSGGGEKDPQGKRLITAQLPARNVPLGLYEAVINTDPEGVKRLYGWRYVGFAPFATCPTTPTGSQAENCATGGIFGLVDEGGIMVFKSLNDIGREPIAPVYVPAPDAPKTKDELQARAELAVAAFVAAAGKAQLSTDNTVKIVRVEAWDFTTLNLTVVTTKPEKPEDVPAITRRLMHVLKDAVRSQPGFKNITLANVALLDPAADAKEQEEKKKKKPDPKLPVPPAPLPAVPPLPGNGAQ